MSDEMDPIGIRTVLNDPDKKTLPGRSFDEKIKFPRYPYQGDVVKNPVLENRFPSNFSDEAPHLPENIRRQMAGLEPDPLRITSANFPIKRAQDLVVDYILSHLDVTDESPNFQVYVVMFSYILGGWKALVSTTLPDGMYYEVTYDVNKKRTYLDAYKKFQNVCIND